MLKLAQDESERLRHPQIGTEHLLLGLLREERGLGALALRALGPSADEVRLRLESQLQPGDVPPDGRRGLSVGCKRVIEMAVSEANRFHHHYLGTEHLLLGLLRVAEGPAFATLDSLGVSLEEGRRQVIKLLNERPSDAGRMPRTGVLGMFRGMRGAASAESREPRPADVGAFGPERCRRCDRPRQSDWRFCGFCGEPSSRCGHCDAPLPGVAEIQYCPHCGGPVNRNEPA